LFKNNEELELLNRFKKLIFLQKLASPEGAARALPPSYATNYICDSKKSWDIHQKLFIIPWELKNPVIQKQVGRPSKIH